METNLDNVNVHQVVNAGSVGVDAAKATIREDSSNNNGLQLCILCCCSFKPTVKRRHLLNDEEDIFRVLSNFQQQLQDIQLNRNRLSSSATPVSSSTFHWNNNNKILGKIKGGGGGEASSKHSFNYSICPSCKILVTSSISKKSELDEMECHVRCLQRAILKALQMLDRQVERFYGEIKKIVEVIELSDKKCLEEKVPSSSRENSVGRSQHPIVDIRSFRETLLNVGINMKRLQGQNMANKLDKTINLRRDVTSKIIINNTNNVSVSTNNEGQNDYNDDRTVEKGQNEELGDNDWEPIDQDYKGSPAYDDGDDNSSDHDATNGSSEASSPRRSKRKRPSRFDEDMSFSKTPAAAYDVDSLKDNPKTYMGKRYSDAFEQVTSGMSKFKAAIVKRTFNKNKRKPRHGDTGPLAYHFVTYNPDTDTLSVDNQIPIKFNEIEELLECTLCRYSCRDVEETVTNKNLAEKKMMYHILGKHMHVFRCDLCDIPFDSYAQYSKHQHIHKHAPGGVIPICEICGKKLSSIWTYEEHKWVHMTPEAKEQAKREGKKDPADRNRNYPKIHQCSQCGKSFNRPFALKKHLLIHTNRSAETLMCSGCGKIFKAKGCLTVHQKKKCVQLKETV